MIVSIHNECLRVCAEDLGAELAHICSMETGREFLWQSDPNVWKGRSPLLFPVVGQLKNGSVRIHGQDCALPMHGFARNSTFQVESQTPDCVTFRLCDTQESRALYPAIFSLRVTYRLEGRSLLAEYRVQNQGDQEMFFSLGAHPGFLCAPGDKLVFEKPETLVRRSLAPDTHLLRATGTPFLCQQRELELTASLFDDDALLFHGMRSQCVVLQRKDGSSVEVEYGSAPWLGIWSKAGKGLPYVCIEPWFGVDDPEDATGKIEDKPDIQRLMPENEFVWTMKITPNP